MTRTLPYRSTCSYCGVGCGLRVGKDRRGRLQVAGDVDHPVNRGMLCSKGLNLAYAMEDRGDRLRHPEMRVSRAEPLQRVSWDIAIGRAAATFGLLIQRYGPDAVGFYVSGQCLTEEYYLANKLVKGFLGTNNLDTNSRLCMSSAAVAYTKTLGEDCVPISYDDIELSDCIFIAGANPAWCHPILFRRIERHKAANPGVKIIVADPRRTESCGLADLHLPVRPGTDVALHNAIARVLIERGWIDRAFIRDRVDGFEAYRQSAFALTVDEAASRCGVAADDIVRAASWIGSAKGFLTMWAMGLNQSAMGVDKNLSLIALNLITGQIGKPGSGPFSLTGQPNAMGGREVGGMATLLAAHRTLSNPRHRAEVAEFWGVEGIRPDPGLTATEMFDALADGRLKAIWIIATNPMVSLPDLNRAERALERAEFVVVQDISRRSDTLRFADIVLPAAGHFEKDGTMTNSERRIGYLEKVIDPPGEALPDTEIIQRFARAMGFHGFDFPSTAEIFDEYTRLTAGTNIDISGLSHDVLRARGSVQWPYTSAAAASGGDGVGTARLFTDHRFHTPDGKARLHGVDAGALRSEVTSAELPLVLTTGRIRDQWHTMTKTGKVRRLTQHIERPFVALHPDDAAARSIEDGDVVRVWNARGEVRVAAEITDDVPRGVVFVPMHWGRIGDQAAARANNLTALLVDPESKEPDFKYAAVQAERVVKTRERIVVVGAGAAAYRFVNAYRELGADDEIHVFSGEPHPFYDRVRLPEYVSERFAWNDLLKFRDGELERLNLHLHRSTAIVAIDRQARVVVDERGGRHPYDRLVVATGSRAFVPADSALSTPGTITMRTRADAERLKASLTAGSRVLVVGGGLLGLELAAALCEMAVTVTVIELGPRLMERQLDPVAGELLLACVEEMGIEVRLCEQVRSIERLGVAEESPLRVTSSGGSVHEFDAVVVAIGTRPNIELLATAGIECGRGARVNDHLQTSDPRVYAMGEVAEHRGLLHGVTAAAEEQAEVVARHIAGDVLAAYEGSVRMNVLKLAEVHLSSIGLPEAPTGEEGYEEIVVLDRAEGYYKKCVIKDDRLVGAILLGDKAELAEFRDLIASGLELGDRRSRLLRGGPAASPRRGRLVCSCGSVGDGNIEDAIASGCTELGAVCTTTGAGVGCGSCKPEIRRILDTALVGAA
jgi:ferredoxin-nitrate reductase